MINPFLLAFVIALSIYFAIIFFVFYKLEQRREAKMEERLSIFLRTYADKLDKVLEEGKDGKKEG